jgi:hypothetical protein
VAPHHRPGLDIEVEQQGICGSRWAIRNLPFPELARAVNGVGEWPPGRVTEGRRCQAWRSKMWMIDTPSSKANAISVPLGVTQRSSHRRARRLCRPGICLPLSLD